MSNPLDQLAAIAEAQIGNEESPRGSNRGPAIAKYFSADAYQPNGANGRDDGYAWCASFVSWCVQEFLIKGTGPLFKVEAPRLSAAFAFRAWAKANGAMLFLPSQCEAGKLWPDRGDIVTFNFSHVGIVAAANQRGGENFTSIEGNSNSGGSREGFAVVRHPRTFAAVREFIRLTPRAVATSEAQAV